MHGIDTTFLVQIELREVSGHQAAKAWLDAQIEAPLPCLALVPQVLTEFVHVVTDARRFSHPLAMDDALDRAQLWWEAKEVKPVFPSLESVRLSMRWMREHRLGRKRILDTELAATYHTNGIVSMLTLNTADFEVFDAFDFPRY